MEPFETEPVHTDVGEYTIAWHVDTDAERPYNEGLGFAYDGGRDRTDVAEGEHAGEVLAILKSNLCGHHSDGRSIYRHSVAAMARWLHAKYGLIGIREVDYDYDTSEPSSDRSAKVYGIAWAPSDATDPDAYTDAAIAEYRAWAQGDCFGYIVTGPDGNEIDACWGFYGWDASYADAAGYALAAVKNDAAQRTEKTNLVGAGFVGII